MRLWRHRLCLGRYSMSLLPSPWCAAPQQDSIFHISALLLPRNSVTTEGSTSTSS